MMLMHMRSRSLSRRQLACCRFHGHRVRVV
jgi:hypothetical protein